MNAGHAIASSSPEETERAGEELASSLRGGELVLLRGPLGAGKSVFARGIAQGLGVRGWRGSPTFNLVHEYAGSRDLVHLDLFRLDSEDVEELGLEEYVQPGSVMVVEWPERAPTYLNRLGQREIIEVELTYLGPEAREIKTERRAGSLRE